ncbi:glycerol-3-phosphate O-acyltransferase [Peniophora sp. CONT]|nr:glycerol-3-phosphate O-acyltransferase [Peniophora sp. CONT]
MSHPVYEAQLSFWRTVISIFFREIRPRGAFNIPKDGPVIFVGAPHHNQFLDPLLLSLNVHKETRRKVNFLTAAKSLARPEIRYFAQMMGSIPVARAADYAKAGKGRVSLSPDDATLIIGHGTAFTEDFGPRSQIMLPKSVGSCLAEVAEVLSDTELRLKKEFGGESGKTTGRVREKLRELEEQGTTGLEFKKMPYVDQADMYKTVYQELKEGNCLGIFPEGGSHDRTDLLPLKAGVSIMALGAMANDPSCKVRIVPVGLSYFHPHRFRSRAVVEFGTAMDVPPELVEMFKQGGPSKREAVAKLLDIIYDSLKAVTVRAPDYETLMVCQAARRLYRSPGQNLTLGQVVELNKRFIEGYTHFRDEPRVQALKEKVLKYNRLVHDLGLRDHQVPGARKSSWKTLGLLLYRVGLLSVWSVLALPGVILNGPIFLTASILSRKKAKEALAASVVKVEGRDVIATWKVLISLGLTPVLYLIYAFIATIVAAKAGAPLRWRIWTPVLVMAALPIIGFGALKFGEAGMDVLKSLRPLVVALVPGQQRSLARAKQMRVELSNELIEVINQFAPKLYRDFDRWRILVPQAQVPPSSGTAPAPVGAVDGQAELLTHPMTWLDEHLFGWTTSARRGTSAWAGRDSGEASRAPSPGPGHESDDEHDYEHVLGIVRALAGGDRSANRSRKMRSNGHGGVNGMSPVEEKGKSTAVSGAGEERETHRRQRRPTLTDGVPVARIGSLERGEGFDECTRKINGEIEEQRNSPTHERGPA